MHNARCRDRNRLNANEIIDHGSDNDIQNKLNRILRPVGLPEAQPGRGLDAQHPSPARTAAVHDHIVPGHVAGKLPSTGIESQSGILFWLPAGCAG